MKKYLISSAIAWTIFLCIIIAFCTVFWKSLGWQVFIHMLTPICLLVYNVIVDYRFFKKYGWTI